MVRSVAINIGVLGITRVKYRNRPLFDGVSIDYEIRRGRPIGSLKGYSRRVKLILLRVVEVPKEVARKR